MPNRRQPSRGLIAAIAATITLMLCITAGALSYGYASQTAADLETRINAAKAAVATDTAILREDLGAGTKFNPLTDAQALHLAELAQKHPGPRGIRIVALELAERDPRAAIVDDKLLVSLENTLKKHRKMASKHRMTLAMLQAEYNGHLRSAWLGRWMRLAGYPKLNTKKAVKPPVVSKGLLKTPALDAPVSYTPHRTE